jgi:hypothetical protein
MESLTRRAFGVAGMEAALANAAAVRTATMAPPPPGWGACVGLKLPAGYGTILSGMAIAQGAHVTIGKFARPTLRNCYHKSLRAA